MIGIEFVIKVIHVLTFRKKEILTHVETKHPEFKREHLLTAAKNDTAVAKRNLEERDYKVSQTLLRTLEKVWDAD